MKKYCCLSIVSPNGRKIAAGEKTLEIRKWKPPIIPIRDLLIVENREWSLPGGKMENDESVADGIKREIWEETGLDISIQRLLYITEVPENNLVYMTYLCNKKGGIIRLPSNEHDKNPISDVRFVPVNQLQEYGFRREFQQLIVKQFPNCGNYMGRKENIGL